MNTQELHTKTSAIERSARENILKLRGMKLGKRKRAKIEARLEGVITAFNAVNIAIPNMCSSNHYDPEKYAGTRLRELRREALHSIKLPEKMHLLTVFEREYYQAKSKAYYAIYKMLIEVK